MRIWLTVLLAMGMTFSTSCTVAKESSNPNWAMATSGEQYERLLWNSVKAKNWRDVESHLSGTLVMQDAEGIRNKQQALADYFHPMSLSDYSIGDLKTETSGADLVVTYTITLQGTFDGHPLPDKPVHMMSVWQQVSKGMLLVAHSATPVL